MTINGYTLITELKNANSGFSKWGFCTRNGKEYFIKELITPVYPIDRSVMTDELFNERRNFCHEYEEKFKSFFERINRASHGNLVRINEFFRYGGKYYIITDKVYGENLSVEYISSLNAAKKFLLLKTVAHCFRDLHFARVVHFDVKTTNIIIEATKRGNYTAKLIDFDSGFTIGDKIEEQDLGGDLTYLAPETFLAIYGEDVRPDEKADIFSLGLVFHEYWTGKLPYYNESEYEYPYEASLDGGEIKVDTAKIPAEIADIIVTMLDADPAKRPSAEEIIVMFNRMDASSFGGGGSKEHDVATPPPPPEKPIVNIKNDEWFNQAGDL